MTDTVSGAISTGQSAQRPSRGAPSLMGMQLPALMVIAGASLTFLVIAAEYFNPYPHFGVRQLLAAGGGIALALAGAAFEVREGTRSLAETLRFWLVAAFVSLIFLVFRLYNLETRAFCEFVAPLVVAGFVINHYLAPDLRKPFFVLLSLAGVLGVFGIASPVAALGLIGGGLVLIGICHLPIPMWARLLILGACTVFLAALRLGWLYQGWIAAILPILTSIFMFRLAIYLYDISHGKGPKGFWNRVGYFFMLPNLVFPFFPVVDYSAFGRTYYNDDAIRIYRRGASFIFRGLIHLLLYRVVQVYFVLTPDQIVDGLTFMQHVASNFGLYLRISGLFHFIVGLLLLFGYNLPETHSRFYFSNSFIDFWRRINIYWKDFMQKMVFNPSYMQFKKIGAPHLTSVVLSMAVVFIATWALHAYQWFWLSGTLLFSTTDILFWTILGVFLIIQTLLEARPKKPSAGGLLGPRSFLVLRTVCTMFTICLLWSFWTSPSAADWFDIVARSRLMPGLTDRANADLADWAATGVSLVVVAFAVLVTVGLTFGLPKPVTGAAPRRARPAAPQKPAAFYRAIAVAAVPVLVLAAAQTPAVASMIGERESHALRVLAGLELSEGDIAMRDRGYYEGLAGDGAVNAELNEFLQPREDRIAANEAIPSEAGFIVREDYLHREFAPNATGTRGGAEFQTNRWGMYDRDYEMAKPEGVFRIALLGDSRGMGWGVPYSDRFETLLEQRLNEQGLLDGYDDYEILNFSLYGYNPAQRVMVLETKVLPFKPDMVIYLAGPLDFTHDHTARMVKRGVAMPYPYLEDILKRAGIKRSMSMAELERRLKPYTMELLDRAFGDFVSKAREHQMQPLWIEVPGTTDKDRDIAGLVRSAQSAGFETINLSDRIDPSIYRISRWDGHYNSEGNGVLAGLMYDELVALKAAGRIAMPSATTD